MAVGDTNTNVGLGADHVTTASAAGFIPEIWSDEIISVYELNLVMAPLIKKMSMKGKKGDTIHVPRPYRHSAVAKTANTAVTIASDETDTLDISIDQHWEYSRHIEDIVEVQALSTLRQFYTEDAGYALAKQLDDYIFSLCTGLGDGDGATSATPVNWENTATFRPQAAAVAGTLELWAQDTSQTDDLFTDVSFRHGLQKLDDLNVPMNNRYYVIPPSLANIMRGIDRYNSADFVSTTGKVQNGKIGDLYGVEIYVSTNVAEMESVAENAVATLKAISRASIMGHRDAFVCAEQVGVRSQTQYQQEYLATLYTADRIYGASVYRPDNAIVISISE